MGISFARAFKPAPLIPLTKDPEIKLGQTSVEAKKLGHDEKKSGMPRAGENTGRLLAAGLIQADYRQNMHLESKMAGIESFNPMDWGHLNQYIFQDAALHVKTGGHYWKETFSNSGLNKNFEPENRVQFGLPYVKIPKEKAMILQHQNAFPMDFQDQTHVFVPIHPSYLDDKNKERFTRYCEKNAFEVIDPSDSKFLATPTSSYRTLVVKNKDSNSFFQVKVGAPGRVLGANRDLWHEEVDISVEVAKKISNVPELQHCGIEFMSEDAGIISKLGDEVDRSEIIPLNCLFRKLPNKGEQYYNFSALFSTVAQKNPRGEAIDPLIYTFANNYIKANKIEDRREGLKLFIMDIVDRFVHGATIFLKHGIVFEPHSQNLGVKVKNGTIEGFFIRDGGGFSLAQMNHSVDEKMPKKQQDEMLAERKKKSDDFNKNVINSMSIFFSFYVMEKLGKLFLKDSLEEDVYGRLGLDHPLLQGKYRVMSKENVLIQSGPNVQNRIHKGFSPLDPRPLERAQITDENKDLFLSGKEIDEIRQHIKFSYIEQIEKNIGVMPDLAKNVILDFKGVERGAENSDKTKVEVPTFPFDQWLKEMHSLKQE